MAMATVKVKVMVMVKVMGRGTASVRIPRLVYIPRRLVLVLVLVLGRGGPGCQAMQCALHLDAVTAHLDENLDGFGHDQQPGWPFCGSFLQHAGAAACARPADRPNSGPSSPEHPTSILSSRPNPTKVQTTPATQIDMLARPAPSSVNRGRQQQDDPAVVGVLPLTAGPGKGAMLITRSK